MKLSKSFTTVTPLSKSIALALVIALPFLGFYFGIQYERAVQTANTPVPTVYQKQPSEQKTGQMCGGFAGIDCPTGYTCQITDKNVADASGICVPK